MLQNMWKDATEPGAERRFWWGIMAWVGIAVAAVLLRGVRWDENYEFAQVLLGEVVYPEGHHLARYVQGFYSLQTWALAGVMAVVEGPALPNFLRNVLAFLATVLPAYSITAAFSRNWVYPHLSAVLMLTGMHVHFYSNYPVQVWPDFYSNGHVGTGWALLTLGLLLGGRVRSGMLLLGLMPAIHLGQAPPLFFAVGGIFALGVLQKTPPFSLKALYWALPGFLVSGALALWIGINFPSIPTVDPWMGSAYADEVLHGYMAHHASHRAIPWGSGHVPLLLLLGLIALQLFQREEGTVHQNRFKFVGLYGLGLALCVWGIIGIHMVLGPTISSLLISWMPYRLLNHAAPILIAVCVGMCVVHPKRAWILSVVFGAMLLEPIAAQLLPEKYFARYIAGGEAYLFVLVGLAISVAFQSVERNKLSSILVGVVLLCMVFLHQFALVIIILTSICFYLFKKVALELRVFSLALAALLLCVMLYQQSPPSTWLPVSDIESQVVEHLADCEQENPVLLVRDQQEGLQGRMGVPVMADMATLTWVPYRADLRPGLEQLYRELYGRQLLEPAQQSRPWHQLWQEFTSEEWNELGIRYGFNHVYTPDSIALNLTEVLSGDGHTLWTISSCK